MLDPVFTEAFKCSFIKSYIQIYDIINQILSFEHGSFENIQKDIEARKLNQ